MSMKARIMLAAALAVLAGPAAAQKKPAAAKPAKPAAKPTGAGAACVSCHAKEHASFHAPALAALTA